MTIEECSGRRQGKVELTKAFSDSLTNSSPRSPSRSPAIQIETAVLLSASKHFKAVKCRVSNARNQRRSASCSLRSSLELTRVDPLLPDPVLLVVLTQKPDHIHNLQLLALSSPLEDDSVPSLRRLRQVVEINGRVDSILRSFFSDASEGDLKDCDQRDTQDEVSAKSER